MAPLYFLVAFYLFAYLVLGGGAYVTVAVLAGHNALGKRLFFSVFSFGVVALMGYVIASIAFSFLHPYSSGLVETPEWLQAIFYFLPGCAGAWSVWQLTKRLAHRRRPVS